MKKLFAVAAMTIAATSATSVMADNGLFVGAEFGKAKTTTETLGQKETSKLNQYGLRVGTYLNDNVRVYANLNQLKDDANAQGINDGQSVSLYGKMTNRQLTVSADYVFDFGSPVKPFVGATVGTNWTELKMDIAIDSTVYSDKDSKFGLAYGAQAGVMGQFGQFDIELGYRYLKLNTENKIFNDSIKVKAKDSQTPYLAVSYKF